VGEVAARQKRRGPAGAAPQMYRVHAAQGASMAALTLPV
jgi:hypothetical protein